MTLKNNAARWGAVSQAFHWISVLLIITIATIGLTMGEMAASPLKIRIYALHKSLGLTLLAIVLARLAWRAYAGASPPVPGMPRWQRIAADASHWGLYALMLGMPLTGWWLNSSAGYPLQWFGLVNLPKIAATDEARNALATSLHVAGFWLLATLVVVHAGAAWFHHLIQRDITLLRMLPGRRARAATLARSQSNWMETPDAP